MDAAALSERRWFWIAAIAVALTRPLALSQTLWDWDEALFALALREYDVTLYHPHPPGFPLFIALAKALAKLIPLDAFPALQSITFVASLLVFPAAYLLASELRSVPRFLGVPRSSSEPETSAEELRGIEELRGTPMAAGLLLAFFPNVWFYGGTALSDVPSMVLSLFACALLLRGCRDARALVAGAFVLGIAAAFRPQNLLIALVPFAIAFFCQRRVALLGGAIVGAILVASYAGAAIATGGWEIYRETLAIHEQYIRETDSFLAAGRPSLLRVADDFFYRPYRQPLLNAAIALLALAALVRRSRQTLAALAIFGPFCVFAWLYLDFHSASRFSIAYMPLFALLAADGLAVARRARGIVLAALVIAMMAFMFPALRIVRTTPSPPVAAIESIQLDPRTSLLYVDQRLGAHGELLLPQFERRPSSEHPPAVFHERAHVVLLREGGGQFIRERAPLARIARDRYFEASVVPAKRISFGDGWYGEEGPLRAPWRWMGKRARAALPQRGKLYLRISVPVDTTVDVFLDGKLAARIDAKRGTHERTLDTGNARELMIETAKTTRAPADPRELGVRLDWLEIRVGT